MKESKLPPGTANILPICPICGDPLIRDWHGVQACFCLFDGLPPTIEQIVEIAEKYEGMNTDQIKAVIVSGTAGYPLSKTYH